MKQLNKERFFWVDNLRAFAIILVVLGHNYFFLSGYISTFHVPIFFIISGYLFNNNRDFKEFIKRKINSLIKPYFFFSFSLYLYWLIIGNKMGGNAGQNSALKGFIGIFYGVEKQYIFWQSGLWFVLCLFIINVMYYFISKYFDRISKVIILITCLLIGWFTSVKLPIRLPWSIDVAFTALVFFIVGNIIKKKKIDKYLKERVNNKTKVILLLFLISINVIVYKINGEVSFFSNYYNNYIIFIIGSLCGTMFYFFAFMFFNYYNKRLSLIGKESLIILAYHGIVVQGIKFIQTKILNIPMNRNDIYLTPIVYCIGQVIICIIIAFILKRLFKKIFI